MTLWSLKLVIDRDQQEGVHGLYRAQGLGEMSVGAQKFRDASILAYLDVKKN